MKSILNTTGIYEPTELMAVAMGYDQADEETKAKVRELLGVGQRVELPETTLNAFFNGGDGQTTA